MNTGNDCILEIIQRGFKAASALRGHDTQLVKEHKLLQHKTMK